MNSKKRRELIQELAAKHIPGRDVKIPGRANTKEEKEQILVRIARVWDENPGMRFGQLLMNLKYEPVDLFVIEDYDLAEKLEGFYDYHKTL